MSIACPAAAFEPVAGTGVPGEVDGARARSCAKGGAVRRVHEDGCIVATAVDRSNDAPVPARANMGIAMSTGSNVATESAVVTPVNGDRQRAARARWWSHAALRGLRRAPCSAFIGDAPGGTVTARVRPTRTAAGAALLATALLAGCGEESAPGAGTAVGRESVPSNVDEIPPRWYAPEHVARGGRAYARLCAGCHGDRAQGVADWRTRGPDGRFPPPPLDGTAHAWHHPIRALVTQILHGAPGGSGNMPGFAGVLGEEQALEIIAWFQDRWRDEVYAAWHQIEVRSRAESR